jgi:hypothetical protein
MKNLRSKFAGFGIPDVLVGAAVSAVLAAGMLTTITSLQRTSAASHHHAQSQIQQARLLDYMARDLRRALSVQVDSFRGSERLKLTIPDYYDPTGGPREPVIDGGGVRYGDNAAGIAISYFKEGDKVFRSVNGVNREIASDLQSFNIDYTDSGEQAVTVAVSFVPRYQGVDSMAPREATTAYCTTLLRNKRQ